MYLLLPQAVGHEISFLLCLGVYIYTPFAAKGLKYWKYIPERVECFERNLSQYRLISTASNHSNCHAQMSWPESQESEYAHVVVPK